MSDEKAKATVEQITAYYLSRIPSDLWQKAQEEAMIYGRIKPETEKALNDYMDKLRDDINAGKM
jgi:hypothetical protein